MPALSSASRQPLHVAVQRRRRRPTTLEDIASLASATGAATATGAHGGTPSQARRRAVRAAQRPTAPLLHAVQRAELQRLQSSVIPALEAARQRLSVTQTDPFNIDPLGLDKGPTTLDRTNELVQVERRLDAANTRMRELAGEIRERRGQRAEQITALEAIGALVGAIPPVRGAQLAGAAGKALLRGGAEEGGEVAAKAILPKATSAAAAAGGQGATRSTARMLAAALGKGAKGAGKAATYPIRHPIKTAKYQVAAQAPVAVASGDPVKSLNDLLSGQGVAAKALTGIGDAVGSVVPGEIGGNLVRDVFDLPAQTIPALYMPAAAAVEAVQGDTSRAEALWSSYVDTGLLPALVSGDLKGAGDAITEHPLFAALEARGAQAVGGRAAGAALRSGAAGPAGAALASTARKPLRLGGRLAPAERRYSPDLFEKTVQVMFDRSRARRQGGQRATPGELERILRERVDRIVAQEEGARRGGRAAQADAARAVRPKSKVERDAVSLAVQGIVRSPETFALDLAGYVRKLDSSATDLQGRIGGASPLKRAALEDQLKTNRALRERLSTIIEKADPEQVFTSARANVGALRKLDDELVDKGLLDSGQAAQARLIPFARTHLGAKYGVSNANKAKIDALRSQAQASCSAVEKAAIRGKISSLRQRKQLLDSKGDPLGPAKLEQIRREMGGEETGFVSQSPSARGARSFYRSFSGQRQSIGGNKRQGKATLRGTFDHSYDAIAEQRMRGQGIVDAVRGWDRTMREFAVGGKRFGPEKGADGAETRSAFRVAENAARHPEMFGLPRDMELKAVRLAPLRSGSEETRRAEEIFDQLDPSNQRALEGATDQILANALQDGPGPAIVVPKQAVDRLREHVQSATTLQRAIQVISSGFKSVILPWSPRWVLGNFFDVNMRTLMSGTTPYGTNARLGRRLLRELEQQNPEMAQRVKAGLVPGTLYGAAEGTRVFRDARQFVGTWLAPVARRMGALRRTPGPKQLIDLYTWGARGIMHLNEVFIERQPQYAMLGKVARRELQATTGKWHGSLGVSDDAVRDLAKGLLQTPKQIQYAKEIEQTLGQWTANSPDAKRFLVDYMPFGMWSRAALRFVYLTVPAKHPIFASLAAMAYEATEEERDRLGLSLFANRPLPPGLQGSLPRADGGVTPVQSLSSFGYTSDWQRALAESILPQFNLDAFRGYDWTGEQLTHEDGTPLDPIERAAAALGATLESYVPFVALGKRVEEKGLVEALNPLRALDAGTVDWLRDLAGSMQITVPAKGRGGGGGKPSGGATAPWMQEQTSTPVAPWMETETSTEVAPWMD